MVNGCPLKSEFQGKLDLIASVVTNISSSKIFRLGSLFISPST